MDPVEGCQIINTNFGSVEQSVGTLTSICVPTLQDITNGRNPLIFSNIATDDKIYKAKSDPELCHKLRRKLMGFNRRKWKSQRENMIESEIFAKF